MERYENLGVVGEGSYGVVLKCRHKETGQVVAVKKFLEGEDDPSVKKIALREVRMLKRLRHENLINLIEFFRRKRRLYLVFEYVDHTILDELEKADGGLSEGVARAHIFQVLRGIAFCHHNQIIHRDIKPENVLVSRMGVIKLCDFGFARPMSNPGEAFTDYVATRWYRAPELLVGDTRYGKEVDVWAIGCLLAEMLTADPLFPGESDIDQLFHIIQALGELSSHHQTLVEKNPMMSGLRLPAAASSPLEKSYPSWSNRSLSFIKACLHLSPHDRPSAQSLLAHEFFLHDSFPDYFLLELRKKVQQEFNGNALLSKDVRRSSGGGIATRKTKRGKDGLLSPEAIYTKSVSQGSQSVKMEGAPRRNSIKNATTIQSSNASRGPGLAYGMFSERRGINLEDGPPSLPLSTMPPLRDSNFANNNANNSNQTNYSDSIFTLQNKHSQNNSGNAYGSKSTKPYSGSPTKAGSLGMHISSFSSPSRTTERGRKSPLSSWSSSNLRMPGNISSGISLPYSIDGRQQRSNSTPDEDDINLNMLLNETSVANQPNTTSTLSSSRNYPFAFQKHPYTISLDQTKELTSKNLDSLSQKEFPVHSRDHIIRDQLSRDHHSRDPLREIKDNREGGRHSKHEIQDGGGSLRKSKKEISNWVKSKFNNDDLSLPSVPGVVGVNLGSPLKSNRGGLDSSIFGGTGDNLSSSMSGGRTRRTTGGTSGGGVSMPALSNTQRASGHSILPQRTPQMQTYHSFDDKRALESILTTKNLSRKHSETTSSVAELAEKPSRHKKKTFQSFELLDDILEPRTSKIHPVGKTKAQRKDLAFGRNSYGGGARVPSYSASRSSVSAQSPSRNNISPMTRQTVSADAFLYYGKKNSLPTLHGKTVENLSTVGFEHTKAKKSKSNRRASNTFPSSIFD